MKAAAAVAEVLKREGVKFLIGYPVNPIIEAAAEADIRTIIAYEEAHKDRQRLVSAAKTRVADIAQEVVGLS